MRDLTFFTTSAIKLAQSRYIAEDFGARVKGFRQRTYHADYFEPRLSCRKEILEQSYRSAVQQCAKAQLSIDSHCFFLEDTSVRIDALSSSELDVPGVDIKYWMKGKEFSDLDRELRSHGNDRSVTVRSDVLLHIPRSFRSAWGIEEEYLIFVGEQAGTIVSSEQCFSSNLVFPWLDNKTFNKWFMPDGRAHPLGALSIGQSRGVDFRAKSLLLMFEFLQEKGYLSKNKVQMKFDLDVGRNIILCGYTCAGKTLSSQFMTLKYGYLHVEASDFMHLSYLYRHGYKGPIAIGDFAEAALAQKPEIAAEQVVEYLNAHPHLPTVISGFRSPEEVNYLQSAFAEGGRHFDVIFIDADESLRFQRINERRRPGDDIPLEKFRDRDAQQRRMGLDEIQRDLLTTILHNDSDVAALEDKVTALAGSTKIAPIDLVDSFNSLSQITEVKLEDAILVALLSKWEVAESRPSYSTTAISRLVNELFASAAPKHKDNVSRYFNQDFYSYYEIAGDKGEGRRYRLSNTGYGYAVRALREIVFVPRNLQTADND
jgi:dephospho-CoA kinase